MKFKSTLLILLFFTFNLFAQNKKTTSYQISGQAVEATNGKGIPYVTVTLQNDSAKTIKKISSDASGKFTATVTQMRAYNLIFTSLGYSEVKKKITITDAKTDLGKIAMIEGVALMGVSISAQKTLIKVDADKITYSIESDPDSKTNNALEMLRKVPLITVDGDENIKLNGQTNFKVLVNGKSSSMLSNNFKDVIKTLPASSIKDIEVITNPSSKYEAEGVGGIINIITFRKTLSGYNGSVNTGFDTFGAFNGGIYLSAKLGKFGFSGRYSLSQSKRPESTSTSSRENLLSTGVNQYYTNTASSSTSKGFSQNFNGEASYEIDSLNLISMSFSGYGSNSNNNGLSTTDILTKELSRTSYFEMLNGGSYSYQSISGNIDYQKLYKKPDKSFTVSYKVDNYPYEYNQSSKTQNTFNYDTYEQNTLRREVSREQTLQVDYYDPLTAVNQLECGIKGIYRENNSNSEYYLLDPLTNNLNQDYAKSNKLEYNQTIVGLYAGYVHKLKKLTIKAGLRAELTWNYAVSKSVKDTSFTNYLQNIVPYITFTYKLKPSQTIRLSYTQRLQRPSIYYLNPYRNQTNRMYLSYGNPNLKSEIAHSFEATYNTFTNKISLNLGATASFNNNSIEQIAFMDTTNVLNTTFDNIGKNIRYGVNTYLSYRPNEKLSLGFNGSVTYSQLEASNMGKIIKNSGLNFSGSLNARMQLWKNGSVSAFWSMYSSSVQLQSKSSAFSSMSISFSQYFLNKKLMLSLNLSEPFMANRIYSYEYLSSDFRMSSQSINPTRSLRVSLSYNFGKMDISVKKARRGISNDDMKSGSSN
jgi:outer membrane receptor protein involved in Fe transport